MDQLPEGWRSVDTVPEAPPAEAPSGLRLDRRAAALVISAAIVLLAAAALLLSTPGGTVERVGVAGAPSPSPTGDAAVITSAGETWMVDVAGAVARPGLYALHPGSRVADAIRAAGGYGPGVDAAAVAATLNLAEVLRDGAKVTVPVRGTRSTPLTGSSGGGSAGGRIDLNAATAQELDTLPGIGPATAAKIIAARAERPFRSVDELLDRKLVRASVLEGLRELVTVGGG